MWPALLIAIASASDPSGWLLRNARVVDSDGVRQVEAIVLRGDRITSVGAVPEDVEGLEELDLNGATVTPGLIDAHVHLSMTPSGAFLDLSRDQELDLWRHHLRAYVACGVTTVLDTGIPPEAAAMMRYLATQGPAPDIQLLGPLLSPEGGYVGVVLPQFPPATDPAAVAEQMAAFDSLDPVGVKVTFERGMITPIWPLYPDDVRQAIREQADARGWRLFAHAMSRDEYDEALDLGVAGFVHPPQKPSRKLIDRLVQDELPVITTLAVFDTLLIAPEPERLDVAPIRAVTPSVELEFAADPTVHAAYARTVADTMLPRQPGFVRQTAANMFQKAGPLNTRLRKMQRAVAKLHDAGVSLVVGSDSGNWPIFPFEFHGPTTLREVELLGEAGLDPLDAIRAATTNAAELLQMSDEIGRVAPGLRADLVVLDDDPLTDLSAFRTPRYVVRAGELATPEQWMAPAE